MNQEVLMPWFAASAIMFVKYKDGKQNGYPVWENVHLIEATTPEEAEQKAIKRAKEDEGDSSGSFVWNDRPATWMFAGIRKILAVSHPDLNGTQFDGAEVTFSEFEVTTEADLNALVNGEDVRILYCAD
ncbi:MAG: DUF4288 domain-containing protein [Deltaproteobacteria bacterium]|nr:DUF4288 domain-containing protein [Deltaproteobacteria bacterium]TLN01266.1 MAG: DUF4288 domain-containing protein [bacterium]